ncbi:MAG: methyltransferase domain-containing protein [Acidobacteriota bacterium]
MVGSFRTGGDASQPARLEIGCGQRPTPGYIHNDVNPFPGVEIVGNPWDIDLADGSLDEVLALGVIEHLTYSQVDSCFANVHRMLCSGGTFWFDVPDLKVWCRYVCDHLDGQATPFPIHHLLATLYGWQRWPGDEHKSGWYEAKLVETLRRAGFGPLRFGVDLFLSRGIERNRMKNPLDAHLYCVATK